MIRTDLKKFESLAETGTIVPVYAEILADMETPVSVLKRFEKDENVFLLESIEGGERVGRYSFIGVNPRGLFLVEEGEAYSLINGIRRKLRYEKNPLDAIRGMIHGKKVAHDSDLPPLPGGAIGYLGYEAVRMFEELPEPKGKTRTPDCMFMITDEIIAFDNVKHTMKIIICSHLDEHQSVRNAYENAVARIGNLTAKLTSPRKEEPTGNLERTLPEMHANMTRKCFMDMVAKGKQYIHDGEAIQIVLSQRFTGKIPATPLELYRALRLINPSPYTFFLKQGNRILVGSSPENMVRLEGNRSSLRPIAGTRKRGQNTAEDRALADELLHDEKERAEHLMLVDLGRNDLGRTAEPGSVQVKTFMNVERYSHVMHLVSEVEAVKREEVDPLELLRTTFPAGTLSGAPKVRAMELIRELEPEPRGVYGGTVGYLSYDGNLDMAITIRTIEIDGEEFHIQAGAGIVQDSDPASEYEETLNKAGALFKALKLAANHFEL